MNLNSNDPTFLALTFGKEQEKLIDAVIEDMTNHIIGNVTKRHKKGKIHYFIVLENVYACYLFGHCQAMKMHNMNGSFI